MIKIVNHPIDTQEVVQSVMSHSAGAIDVFIGTTRNNSGGKNVLWLEYEAFESMALRILGKIVEGTRERWSLCEVSVVHRIGRVDIGESSVVIAVSSAHRDEAFLACRHIIDTLKREVPIWKKEIFEDGEIWVEHRNC